MVDWNSILAYSTLKIVKIKDWKLGVLHYVFMILIIAYILGFTVLYQKRYQAIKTPAGSVRISFLAPEKRTPPAYRKAPEDYHYCKTSVNPVIHTHNHTYDNYECQYWDEQLVVYPPVSGSDILITSRYTESYQVLDHCSLSRPNCSYVSNNVTQHYIAGIEDFTYMFQHTMYTDKFQRSGSEINGVWLDGNGKPVSQDEIQSPNVIGVIGKTDVFTLGFLLNHTEGGISLDDPTSKNRTMRAGGIVILLYIQYTNRETFNQNTFKYYYKPHLIPDTYYKSEQPIYTKDIAKRKIWDRHGVRVIVLQIGEIGSFDFQVLLLTFVSGLGLLAVATTVVDLLAVYLLPKHRVFYKYKYEGTPTSTAPNAGLINSTIYSDAEGFDRA